MSPHGQGSILIRVVSALEGKVIVLCPLGFAATDFASRSRCPQRTPARISSRTRWCWRGSTIHVDDARSAIVLGPFSARLSEAIALAVILVVIYLSLNAIVIFEGLREIARHPQLVDSWKDRSSPDMATP
jgi:hypothetical protein